MLPTTSLTILFGIIGALVGSGGVFAWFKLGPERRKITVDAAQGAVLIQTSVLRDIQEAYDRVSDELGQVRMEARSREEENEDLRGQIRELQRTVAFLRRDLDRHGRMAELARRKSHLALNALGNFELHVDNLLAVMRDNNIPIKPIMRPHRLREAFQQEMNKLEKMETEILEQAMKADAPDDEA